MAKPKSKPGSDDKRKPRHSKDANRPSKGTLGQRDAATVRRLNMYNTRPTRDKRGKLIREELQSKELPTTRIQPDRRWFGNTRVIGQKQLEQFRTEMSSKVNDAYTVLLREKKLPLQLLEDPEQRKVGGKAARSHLLATQPFAETFSAKRRMKRPRLAVESLDQLVQQADTLEEGYDHGADKASAANLSAVADDYRTAAKDSVFEKGQSKRIWGELYKVLDSSDVIIEVLDARDPLGTRCRFLETHIKKNARHKHVLLLLNKCDLVPAWVTKRWLHHLSREYPTLAFHASITNPFGKGSLLSLLRQLARLRPDKQAISVGFVGYPNVGKSSVINALRTKAVCKTAPVPGETKVWQYITLMKRIFLIDCPGVVYNRTSDSETDAVLKGVVRVENLADAAEHVGQVLERVKPDYLRRAYKLKSWTDPEDFLAQVATLSGKLLRGGDPDLNTAARMVLYDWQRGKIPFFTLPPGHTEEKPAPAAPAATVEAAAVEPAGPPAAEADGPAAMVVDGADELPLPAEAVTEQDAEREPGARSQDAAAAARAVRETIRTAAALQSRRAIPVQQDYFLPDDLGVEGEDDDLAASGDDEDVITDDDAQGDAADSSDPEASDEERPSGSFSDEDEQQDAAAPSTSARGRKRQQQQQEAPSGRGSKRRREEAAAPAGEPDDGEESDGYGDAGLSWEAVLEAVQGGGAAADVDVPTGDTDHIASAADKADASSTPGAQRINRKRSRSKGPDSSAKDKGKKNDRKRGSLKTLD